MTHQNELGISETDNPQLRRPNSQLRRTAHNSDGGCPLWNTICLSLLDGKYMTSQENKCRRKQKICNCFICLYGASIQFNRYVFLIQKIRIVTYLVQLYVKDYQGQI